MRPIPALVLAALLAGCAAPQEPVAAADVAANATPLAGDALLAAVRGGARENLSLVDTPFRVEGEMGRYVCTFGAIRHECNGEPGSNEFVALEFPGVALRIVGNVTLEDAPYATGRVDAFLLHGGEGNWTNDFPNDPYASGPSPQSWDWDVARFAGEPLGIYVFGSHAAGTDVVGVSVVPPQRFVLEALVTSAVG